MPPGELYFRAARSPARRRVTSAGCRKGRHILKRMRASSSRPSGCESRDLARCCREQSGVGLHSHPHLHLHLRDVVAKRIEVPARRPRRRPG